MNIIKNLKWRYACKKFDINKTLTDKKISNLKKVFNLTATSFGLQPIKMLVIKNAKIKTSLLKYAYYQQQVTTCSHLLVLCIDTEINTKTIDTYFDLEKQIRGTPEEVIGKYRKQLKVDYIKKSKQEVEQSAIYQAYIALGNLMTVCAIKKIDSCPMEGFDTVKFDEILKLKELNLKSVLLLPVGYRDKTDFMRKLKKVRKPLKKIIIEM
ncbi:MAG: NAD(P)H-dependent oxidoreductase [Flavobacteriaceae bacterium]|nr:NAD(P)H-dependent oxidoreductase [Flavobacteriaceae bacterium]